MSDEDERVTPASSKIRKHLLPEKTGYTPSMGRRIAAGDLPREFLRELRRWNKK